MHFALVIPTYNRIEKLQRCVDSIWASTHQNFDIFVMCDHNDEETYNYWRQDPMRNKKVVPMLMTEHRYVMGCWNYFTENHMNAIRDAMVWLVDDVELYPDTLEKLNQYYLKNFPEGDGVVGISQECPGHPDYTYKPFGQVALGKKFIERYKDVNYHVCCDSYVHFFQDEEMYQYSSSIDKFVHCKDAVLKHYHPCFLPEELDDTHHIVRGSVYTEDLETFKRRQKEGLVWGHSFKP